MFETKETGLQTETNKAPENNLIVRFDKKPTRKSAILAQCFSCVGGSRNSLPDSGWRKRIGECNVPDCYIWDYRPFQK
jgi:hypothetical protein